MCSVFTRAPLIAWQSLKQKIVVLSTCEAVYVAAATVACQAAGTLKQKIVVLTSMEAHPSALMVDNQPAKNPDLHGRRKHINIKFHFLRDCVDGGQIVIESVETDRQLADILTKSLRRCGSWS